MRIRTISLTVKKGSTRYISNAIYLLRIEDGEKAHYIYIKNIGGLLNLHHYLEDKDTTCCPICRCSIILKEFDKHISNCQKLSMNTLGDSTIVTLPKLINGTTPVMKFTNHKNKLMRPYIVYADTECSLIPSDDDPLGRNPSEHGVRHDPNKLATHVPNSACIYFVCNYDETQNKQMIWYGENCIYDMVMELYKIAEECIAKMRVNTEMELTRDDKSDFYNSKTCHICGCEFKDNDPLGRNPSAHGVRHEPRVRDHDHRTGKYRGAAHSKCNINYFANRYLPGVMHNLKGYGGHLIIKKTCIR